MMPKNAPGMETSVKFQFHANSRVKTPTAGTVSGTKGCHSGHLMPNITEKPVLSDHLSEVIC